MYGLLILITLFVLLIIGIILYKYVNGYNSKPDFENLGLFTFVSSGVILVLYIISIISMRFEQKQKIIEFETFKTTIEQERLKGELTEIERAAITKEIVYWNQYIEVCKYWDQYFDMHYSEEVVNLKLIK